MVDLGFLLITFFMYITTLARPAVMQLQVPSPYTLPSTAIPAESALVLIPADQHRVAFYRGTENPYQGMHWCSYHEVLHLRKMLITEQERINMLPATLSAEAHKLHILIKPDTSASYKDVVDVLDEMQITAVPYYTVMHISPEEQAALKKFPAPDYGK